MYKCLQNILQPKNIFNFLFELRFKNSIFGSIVLWMDPQKRGNITHLGTVLKTRPIQR